MTVPNELKQLNQWIVWTAGKKPCSAVTMKSLDWTNQKNWTSYDDAVRVQQSNKNMFKGIGFVFTFPYVGIDLDDCIEDGMMNELARNITNNINTFCEYSVSGKGLHLYCKVDKPVGALKTSTIEIYGEGRFFVFTGDTIDEDMTDVTNQTENINKLLQKYAPKKDNTQIKNTNKIENGCRNNQLTAEIGRMFNWYDYNTVLQMAYAFNNTNCMPPLPDKEVEIIVKSISKRNVYARPAYTKQQTPDIVTIQTEEQSENDINLILNKAVPLNEVQSINRDMVKVLSTGIETLDRQMELVFGKLVVISGVNGSGKSTFIGQLMLESLEQNYNVFAYSGELLDYEFQYWIDLQAAGAEFIDQKTSKSGNVYYDVKPNVKSMIHDWYKDRFYLYRNNESMEFTKILETIETFRIHRNCKIIFLDNFLTMDITGLNDKELKAQTIFINSLARYCKEHDVLVFLVIHPKKIYKGICTKGDVLGSGNLTNAIDYLLLVHRNNEAWKTALKDRTLPESIKQTLSNGTNIVEVSKDRWTGKEGLNVPLQYYAESKRLIDIEFPRGVNRKYSWYQEYNQDEIELPEGW